MPHERVYLIVQPISDALLHVDTLSRCEDKQKNLFMRKIAKKNTIQRKSLEYVDCGDNRKHSLLWGLWGLWNLRKKH